MSGHGDSTRAIFFALGANFAIAVAKGVAAFVTGSGAMLAETVHSFADCGNQLLLLLGVKRGQRAPTPEHPLGFGREIYFWSFLVAVMLFSIGGMFSIYEGVHKLQHPEPLESGGWAAGASLQTAVGSYFWSLAQSELSSWDEAVVGMSRVRKPGLTTLRPGVWVK